jgi:hypothetical protein
VWKRLPPEHTASAPTLFERCSASRPLARFPVPRHNGSGQPVMHDYIIFPRLHKESRHRSTQRGKWQSLVHRCAVTQRTTSQVYEDSATRGYSNEARIVPVTCDRHVQRRRKGAHSLVSATRAHVVASGLLAESAAASGERTNTLLWDMDDPVSAARTKIKLSGSFIV